jgi:hypothetical protein
MEGYAHHPEVTTGEMGGVQLLTAEEQAVQERQRKIDQLHSLSDADLIDLYADTSAEIMELDELRSDIQNVLGDRHPEGQERLF